MRIKNNFTLALMLLASLLTTPLASSAADEQAIASLATAINKAGRQRMLTQRIVKAYSQELLDVDTQQIHAQRLAAIELFDRQLAELNAYAPSERVQEQLAVVGKLWTPFKAIASAPISRKGLMALSQSNDDLLGASHKVVLLLEELSGNNLGHLVNIAGRQRMLSQRLAKLYMMRALGFNDPAIIRAFEVARTEFTTALDELQVAKENSPQIDASLREVKRQWVIFEASFKLGDDEYIPLLIAMSSEKVLQRMNEITGMYASLPSQHG